MLFAPVQWVKQFVIIFSTEVNYIMFWKQVILGAVCSCTKTAHPPIHMKALDKGPIDYENLEQQG